MIVVCDARQGDEVKAGQVLGFIEQLGTFMPVEVSPCAQARSRLSYGTAFPICHVQSMASSHAAGRRLSQGMQAEPAQDMYERVECMRRRHRRER